MFLKEFFNAAKSIAVVIVNTFNKVQILNILLS